MTSTHLTGPTALAAVAAGRQRYNPLSHLSPKHAHIAVLARAWVLGDMRNLLNTPDPIRYVSEAAHNRLADRGELERTEAAYQTVRSSVVAMLDATGLATMTPAEREGYRTRWQAQRQSLIEAANNCAGADDLRGALGALLDLCSVDPEAIVTGTYSARDLASILIAHPSLR